MSIYASNDIGLTEATTTVRQYPPAAPSAAALPPPPEPARPRRRMTRRELIETIPGVVAAAPGHGLSRAELADALGIRVSDHDFGIAIGACYKRREIDFAIGYVVAPSPGGRAPGRPNGTPARPRPRAR